MHDPSELFRFAVLANREGTTALGGPRALGPSFLIAFLKSVSNLISNHCF